MRMEKVKQTKLYIPPKNGGEIHGDETHGMGFQSVKKNHPTKNKKQTQGFQQKSRLSKASPFFHISKWDPLHGRIPKPADHSLFEVKLAGEAAKNGWFVLYYIPGSSRYVKCLPFGSFFW